jgi:hypothetical protein
VSQEETRDVVGCQVSDTKGCIPEAFDEKMAGAVPVMGNRYRGKTAFFLEVVLILPAQDRQRRLVDYWFGRVKNALGTEVVQEVTSRLCLTIQEASTGPPFGEEEVDDTLVQISQYQASPSEPLIEGVQQPQSLLHRLPGITQVAESHDKRIQVLAK